MQAWINQHPALFVCCLVAGVVAFRWVLLNLIAWVSGWKILAGRFTAQQPFSRQDSKWNSARMRYFAGYNNCLRVGADHAGLFIQPMLGVRTAHPPLFIPWAEITIEQPAGWLKGGFVSLRLGRSEQIPFTIRQSLAAGLRTAAGSGWPQAPPTPGP